MSAVAAAVLYPYDAARILNRTMAPVLRPWGLSSAMTLGLV